MTTPEPPFCPRWPTDPRLFGPFLRRWFHVLCSLYSGGSPHRAVDLHQYSNGPLLWIGCDCGRSFWGRRPDWMSFPNQASAAGAAKGAVMNEKPDAKAIADAMNQPLVFPAGTLVKFCSLPCRLLADVSFTCATIQANPRAAAAIRKGAGDEEVFLILTGGATPPAWPPAEPPPGGWPDLAPLGRATKP